jgi:hypothetical protein
VPPAKDEEAGLKVSLSIGETRPLRTIRSTEADRHYERYVAPYVTAGQLETNFVFEHVRAD